MKLARCLIHSLTVLAASAMIAGNANAGVITATYSGSVLGDFINVFDYATNTTTDTTDPSVKGTLMTVVFTFTVPNPSAVQSTDGFSYSQLAGGSNYAAPIFLSGLVTVGGNAYSIAGSYAGIAYQQVPDVSNFNTARVTHQAQDLSSSASPVAGGTHFVGTSHFAIGDIINYDGTMPISIDLSQPFNYTVGVNDQLFGSFQLRDYDYFQDSATGARTGQETQAEFDFLLGGVVIARTEVPEPVTVSFFGAGLAGAMAMRRRKKKTA